VLIAAGIYEVWERHAASRAWKGFLAVLVLGIPLHAGLRIKHWYRLEYPWVDQAREVIAGVSRPDDLVITNTGEHRCCSTTSTVMDLPPLWKIPGWE